MPHKWTRKAGLTVQELRINLGLSQSAFSRMVGIKPCYLSQIESGKRVPSIRIYILISRNLSLKFSEFCNLIESNP
jgi:transcriptional regulator with XRE-family HTH domain